MLKATIDSSKKGQAACNLEFSGGPVEVTNDVCNVIRGVYTAFRQNGDIEKALFFRAALTAALEEARIFGRESRESTLISIPKLRKEKPE